MVVEGRSQDGSGRAEHASPASRCGAATRLRSAAAERTGARRRGHGRQTCVHSSSRHPSTRRASGRRRSSSDRRRPSASVSRRDAWVWSTVKMPSAELVAIAEHATTRLCPVVITGPTGIGKSAVAETFLAGLDDSWSVVELFCDPRRSVTPLHPFRPVLPELFTVAAEPSARAVVAALRELWGPANPVLLVDDVDAADPSTRQLLDELPEHLASGLLLLTSRSPSTDRAQRRSRRPHRPRAARPRRITPGRRGGRRRAEAPPRRAQPDRRSRRWRSAAHRRPHRRRAGFPRRRGQRSQLAVRLVDVGPRSPRASAGSRPAAVGARAILRRGGPRSRDCGRRPSGSAAPSWRRSSRPACCGSTTGTTGSPTR